MVAGKIRASSCIHIKFRFSKEQIFMIEKNGGFVC